MKVQKQWFSLLFGIGMVLLMSLLVLSLISYAIPFSKSVKWIENASQAWYQAYSGIEDILFQARGSVGENFSKVSSSPLDYAFKSSGLENRIPKVGEGNSDYDSNWNILSQQEPVQIVIGSGRLSSWVNRLRLNLRVPDYNNDGNPDSLYFVWDPALVNWQLSSAIDVLYAEPWSYIKGSEIEIWYTGSLWISPKNAGKNLSWTIMNFDSFYSSNCSPGNECVLKISLIYPLISASNQETFFPYLEYQIQTSQNIPSRYFSATSSGYANGFTKSLEVSIPQTTTNSAFDFTIFQ